jgi:Fic family protein
MATQNRKLAGSPLGGRIAGKSNPESAIALELTTVGVEDPWPAVGWEEAHWVPDSRNQYSNRERQIQTGPYQRAVPAHIAGVDLEISATLAAEIEEASNEIVRFDAEMGPELEPYGAVLLRSESAASSRIERLTASSRAIATAETGVDSSSSNANEIVANTRTMQAAIDMAETLDGDTVLAMHRTLMATEPDIAGKWRHQQVWIGPGHAGPRIADFVPPASDRVPELMEDLTAFMRRTDLPVLALAAAAHAQFETIHPFVDGNGRTGRALVHAVLRNRGLTVNSTVPVSAGLLTDTDAYFDALTRYRSGEAEPIISMISSATVRAVANGRELVSDLRSVRQGWDKRLRVRKGADAWRLADMLIRQPVVTSDLITRELGVGQNNVNRVLRPFEDAGILVASGSAIRGRRVWRSPEVLAELDDFAERAGRRSYR